MIHGQKNIKTFQMVIDNTGCPRRNVPDFGRVFLMLKYINITQNTYVYFNIRNTLPKSGTFLLGHSVYENREK